eukprot:TRINITY_DN7800_c0_g1_i1.p1 TRINITY_DN7800_c0_g1~~TRINITY_DN7800_c0_g1_i1.p1  ORF type:complete len:173 (-),score=19.95 TRINITY_DN7800_c0_g1_i1:124-621(-)
MSKEPKKKSRKRKDAEEAQEGDEEALEALKESPPPAPELTENVFIDRDYSVGLSTRFDESFPDVLARRNVDPEVYSRAIRHINGFFERAEEVNCTSFWEGCFGLISFWSLFLCYRQKSYRIFDEMRDWIAQENRQNWLPKGLEIMNPISNGLIFLEIHVHPLPKH